MTIDLPSALRRLKPEKHESQIRRRARAETIDGFAREKRPCLIPDTNVYIHSAGGRLPEDVAVVLDRALLLHCSVCLSELTTGIGNADPLHPAWPMTRRHYIDLFAGMTASRILSPDPEVWVEAGLVAGILARTQNFQAHQRKDCLNDALIYLTAAKVGIPVLTSNRDEFDLIQQVAAAGRFIAY